MNPQKLRGEKYVEQVPASIEAEHLSAFTSRLAYPAGRNRKGLEGFSRRPNRARAEGYPPESVKSNDEQEAQEALVPALFARPLRIRSREAAKLNVGN
jgi:hypothetical protein